MTRLRGIVAGIGLLLGIVGAPLALVSWGYLPVSAAALHAEDGTLLLAALTAVGWLSWLAFAVSTVVETITIITGRSHHVPGLSTVQHLASGLLLTAVAALPVANWASAPSGETVSAAPKLPAAPTPITDDTVETDPAAAATTAASTAPASTSAPRASKPASAQTSSASYTVRTGDDLWTIAERTLGDGRQWRSIAALNPGLEDPLTELHAGRRLVLPDQPQVLTATTSHRHSSQVTVVRGDTLSELAQEHLGKASRWPRIAHANAIITDPDHIEVGWKLTIPGKHHDHTASPATPAQSSPPSGTPAPPASSTAPKDSDASQSPSATEGLPATQAPTNQGPAASQNPAASQSPAASQNPTASRGPAASSPPLPSQTASPPVDQKTSSAPAQVPDQPPPVATTPQAPHPGLPLTLGTLAATAVVGTLEVRRALRLRERPLGQHEPPVSDAADRLRTVLHDTQRPEAVDSLTGALQLIAEHCHRHQLAAPPVDTVRLSEQEITFTWRVAASPPPPGFSGDQWRWVLPRDTVVLTDDRPCPYPALVSLGVDGAETVLVDAEQSGVLGVAGAVEQRRSALTAMAVELSCAAWSADARLVVTGPDADLVRLTGEDRVHTATAAEAWDLLRRQIARRRVGLAGQELAKLRVDPDRAEAVAALVFCFFDELTDAEIAALEDLLQGDPIGVAVIVATGSAAEAQWVIDGEATQPAGHLTGHPGSLVAHHIAHPQRAALSELFARRDLVPAPWWNNDNVYQLPHQDGDDVDIVRVLQPTTHPQLQLIGPAELLNPTGPEPTRSRQQLIEVCAWLAEHPGSNATQMAAGLLIAEGTRRSNLSRLRAWLGSDPDGEPYLPDAYSGRISLHPAITSDWHQLQILLKPGITRVSDQALISALELVRGAPLADAAPTQWHWAEELRISISSALRDVGVVLTDRALAINDLDLARWAASRALVVAPDDELLLCARLRTEHQAGNLAETERLVNHLTHQARLLDVDLLPETVELCQHVVEGRLRARA